MKRNTASTTAENEYAFKSQKGLNAEIVRQISAMKNEPEWMTEYRLKAYEHFPEQADADLGR